MNTDEQIKVLKSKINTLASEKAKQVATIIIEELCSETPVDTGRAVSNWRISIDLPLTDEIEPFVAGTKGTAASECIEAVLSQSKAVIETKIPQQNIIIRNNVDYVSYLNDGTSTVEARSFVEKAVMAGKRVI